MLTDDKKFEIHKRIGTISNRIKMKDDKLSAKAGQANKIFALAEINSELNSLKENVSETINSPDAIFDTYLKEIEENCTRLDRAINAI